MTKVGSKLAFLFILALTGLAGLFGALLVGWFVVVARGLYLARHRFTLFLQFCFLYSSVFSGDVVFSLDLPFIFSGMLCTNTWGWNPQDGSSTTWSLTTTINHITPWSTMMIVMMMAWLMMMYIYYGEVCVSRKISTSEQSCKNVLTVPTSWCYFFWPVLIFGKSLRKTGAIFLGGKFVGANFYAFCNYDNNLRRW